MVVRRKTEGINLLLLDNTYQFISDELLDDELISVGWKKQMIRSDR